MYLLLSFLDPAEDFILNLLHSQIALWPAIFLGLEELGIPLPVPGDLIISYTGYRASVGNISMLQAFLEIMLFVIAGSSALYWLSAKYGQKIILKLGKFLDLDQKKLAMVEEKFNKFGPWFIIFGRHLPGLRIPITVFSGMSSIKYPTFIISVIVSAIFWIILYLNLGARLGYKTIRLIHSHRGFALFIIIPIIILIGFYLSLRQRKNGKKSE